MNFWDCSPSDQIAYVDQSSLFLQDPIKFLLNYYKEQSNPLPSHFVIFGDQLRVVRPFLLANNFNECAKFFHVPRIENIAGKWRLAAEYLYVYCRQH